MAAAKKLSPEQIVAKLREAERLQGQGATIPQVCKKLGCAEQTFYRKRWRTRIELANAMFEYLEIWHNRRRRHSALGWLSPIGFETQNKIVVA